MKEIKNTVPMPHPIKLELKCELANCYCNVQTPSGHKLSAETALRIIDLSCKSPRAFLAFSIIAHTLPGNFSGGY